MKERGTHSVNVFDQVNRYAVQPNSIGYFPWLFRRLDLALRFHG